MKFPRAFFALLAKMALEQVVLHENECNKILTNLNSLLYKSAVDGNFITAFYCSFDSNEKELHYSSSGHIAQFIYWKKDDTFIEMESQGLALAFAEIFTQDLMDHLHNFSENDSFDDEAEVRNYTVSALVLNISEISFSKDKISTINFISFLL